MNEDIDSESKGRIVRNGCTAFPFGLADMVVLT
jgi:hypothetical protein